MKPHHIPETSVYYHFYKIYKFSSRLAKVSTPLYYQRVSSWCGWLYRSFPLKKAIKHSMLLCEASHNSLLHYEENSYNKITVTDLPSSPTCKTALLKTEIYSNIKLLGVNAEWFSMDWLCGCREFQLYSSSSTEDFGFHKKPPVVWERTRQSVNYPGNTGEQGKRRVNEILIRFQFESFGFAIL